MHVSVYVCVSVCVCVQTYENKRPASRRNGGSHQSFSLSLFFFPTDIFGSWRKRKSPVCACERLVVSA